MSEKLDWIKYIKEKEDEAISKIYSTYRNDLVNLLASKYNLDINQAKEIFQASIVILYDNIYQGKLTKLTSDSIKHYLFGICKNRVMVLFRLNKKEIFPEVIKEQVSDYNEFEIFNEENPNLNKLIDILEKMQGPCKTILELFYYKKKSYKEITILMNYKNINTAKNQKFKCIQRLRKLMNNT